MCKTGPDRREVRKRPARTGRRSGLENPETVISTHDLSKRYGKKTALDNVSIDIKKGRIYAIVGGDGSGRTTLLRILAGFIPSWKGKVEILGRTGKHGLRMARKSVGAFIDVPACYDELSVGDNLTMRGILIGKRDKERISDLRAKFLLKNRHVGKRGLRSASLGVKQVTGIVAAMVGDPQILLLDEPMYGLDTDGLLAARDEFARLREEKDVTILASVHFPTELDEIATDYIFMDAGRVIGEISADDLKAKIAEGGVEDVGAYYAALKDAKTGKEGTK